MKKSASLISLITAVYLLLGFGSPVFAAGTGLVDLLVNSLSVTSQQAEGGAGAIFNTAKGNMSAEDFSTVTTKMPEVESLIAKAPETGKSSGLLGSASSMLGEKGGSLGKMTGLYDSFSKLGLSKEMIGQFMPIIYNYAESKGGPAISNLLKAALQ